MGRRLSRMLREQGGSAIVEFALIAPALCMTLFGVFELSHQIYATTMLEGAVQKAARDSTIEGDSETAIDARVAHAVHHIVPGADIKFARTAYTNYADVQRPEDFTDLNGDGVCDNGEPFEDANGNGTWDPDRGIAGNGGARDAVLYTVTVTYNRLFPTPAFLGFSPTVTTVAKTVLRNQPYALQAKPATVGNCP